MLFSKLFVLLVAPCFAFRHNINKEIGGDMPIQQSGIIVHMAAARAGINNHLHMAAARAGINRRNKAAADKRAKDAAAKRKRDAKAAEQERQQRALADAKAQKAQKHYNENVQDCEVGEAWSDWTECSAPCGGGMRTATLFRRTVTKEQDTFKYGKSCPNLCLLETNVTRGVSAELQQEWSSKMLAGCGEAKYRTCNHQPCSKDCSIVDLGNRLQAPGSAVAWNFEQLDPADKGCVFQLWRGLDVEGQSRLQLLGETMSLAHGGPNVVYRFSESETPEPLMINHAEGLSNVFLGFRGCELRSHASVADIASSASLAQICLYGGEGFKVDSQVVKLDTAQHRFLSDIRRASREQDYGSEESGYVWPGQLATLAAREGRGVGEASAAGIRIGNDFVLSVNDAPAKPMEPLFVLSVDMAPAKPEPPSIEKGQRGWDEDGDDIRLNFQPPTQDNGAKIEGYTVHARKLFADHTEGNGGHCEMKSLPPCADGIAGQPCVELDMTLKNLALAATFQVRVAARNSAGESRHGAYAIVRTRGRAGVPLEECNVAFWECGDDEESANFLPEAEEEECELGTPSLPVCRMLVRRDFFGKEKCSGKKYWQKCVAYTQDQTAMARQIRKFVETDCVAPWQPMKVCPMAPELQQAPWYLGPLETGSVATGKVEPVNPGTKKCEAPGCKSFNDFFALLGFGHKHCCCNPGKEGDFEDQADEGSTDCACEKTKCSTLGLVEAADAQKSCRH